MPAVYEIELSHKAAKQFHAFASELQRRLKTRIDSLATDPWPREAVKLQGTKDVYRMRVGDYRIVYQVLEETETILIARIAHRRDVYRNL
jgi:mRNA interferase RelE/StbE